MGGISYSIGDDMVTLVTEGDFGLAQIQAAFSEIRAATQLTGPLKVLIEDPGSSFDPDEPTLRALRDIWAEWSETVTLHIALLVTRQVHYGLGRMLDVFAEGRGVHFAVFAERADALTWLRETGP